MLGSSARRQTSSIQEGNEIADAGSHGTKAFSAVDAKDGVTIAILVSPGFVGD